MMYTSIQVSRDIQRKTCMAMFHILLHSLVPFPSDSVEPHVMSCICDPEQLLTSGYQSVFLPAVIAESRFYARGQSTALSEISIQRLSPCFTVSIFGPSGYMLILQHLLLIFVSAVHIFKNAPSLKLSRAFCNTSFIHYLIS